MEDRIEKTVELEAPVARVWRALTDHKEFGHWFRVDLDQKFEAGGKSTGRMTYPGHEGTPWVVYVERMEPEQLFSYRWRPHAIDPEVDYSGDPTTLVEFRLEAMDAATRLSIVESGFDGLPAAQRAEAFRRNEGGWAEQVKNIERHVTTH